MKIAQRIEKLWAELAAKKDCNRELTDTLERALTAMQSFTTHASWSTQEIENLALTNQCLTKIIQLFMAIGNSTDQSEQAKLHAEIYVLAAIMTPGGISTPAEVTNKKDHCIKRLVASALRNYQLWPSKKISMGVFFGFFALYSCLFVGLADYSSRKSYESGKIAEHFNQNIKEKMQKHIENFTQTHSSTTRKDAEKPLITRER